VGRYAVVRADRRLGAPGSGAGERVRWRTDHPVRAVVPAIAERAATLIGQCQLSVPGPREIVAPIAALGRLTLPGHGPAVWPY
jgi:hypothetical protein